MIQRSQTASQYFTDNNLVAVSNQLANKSLSVDDFIVLVKNLDAALSQASDAEKAKQKNNINKLQIAIKEKTVALATQFKDEIANTSTSDKTIAQHMRLMDQLVSREEFIKLTGKDKEGSNKIRDYYTAITDIHAIAFTKEASDLFQSVNSKLNQTPPVHYAVYTNEAMIVSNKQNAIVRMDIVSEEDPERRRIKFERWVNIASKLHKEGNFFSADSIILALAETMTERLFMNKSGEMEGLSNDAVKKFNELKSTYITNAKDLTDNMKAFNGPKLPSIRAWIVMINTTLNLTDAKKEEANQTAKSKNETTHQTPKSMFDEIYRPCEIRGQKDYHGVTGNPVAEDYASVSMKPPILTSITTLLDEKWMKLINDKQNKTFSLSDKSDDDLVKLYIKSIKDMNEICDVIDNNNNVLKIDDELTEPGLSKNELFTRESLSEFKKTTAIPNECKTNREAFIKKLNDNIAKLERIYGVTKSISEKKQ